jgi:hypothetical protein
MKMQSEKEREPILRGSGLFFCPIPFQLLQQGIRQKRWIDLVTALPQVGKRLK